VARKGKLVDLRTQSVKERKGQREWVQISQRSAVVNRRRFVNLTRFFAPIERFWLFRHFPILTWKKLQEEKGLAANGAVGGAVVVVVAAAAAAAAGFTPVFRFG